MSAERSPLDLLNREGLDEAMSREPFARIGRLLGTCDVVADRIEGLSNYLAKNPTHTQAVVELLGQMAEYARKAARECK